MPESQSLLSFFLQPSLLSIAVTALIVFSIPLFLHLIIYRSPSATQLPTFLLTGPSGAGKTSLLTLFERGHPSLTRPSQTPLTVQCSLPTSTRPRSSAYRSEHDPNSLTHQKFLLADTPGHGKLRHFALEQVIRPQNLKGIIFVVDAADLSSFSSAAAVAAAAVTDGGSTPGETLRQTAEYLHDVLLTLQKRAAAAVQRGGGGRAGRGAPAVLIAANKLDLFTALPAPLVRTALEAEITLVRTSRQKGLLDSGVGMDDEGTGERDWLGEEGQDKFTFAQMEELGVSVSVRGGNVSGGEQPDVKDWWAWIAEFL